MQPGRLTVITGPSGVGKGTLVQRLLARHPDLYLSVSATTRSPRPGEVNGKDYYFLPRSDFEEKIAAGQFLEWAEFAGNYYGTPRDPIETKLAEGQTVLLEIELQGARQIRQTFPSATRIFLLPPDRTELERRLRGRGQDTEEAIARRLDRAIEELAASSEFDYQIVNDDLETALARVESIVFGRSEPGKDGGNEGDGENGEDRKEII
ncbi:guanylate kinase [Pannus brasiliensis]|uniref:guanylate kinase n=1 Tax=Pannus brasiliensis TaxID=1579216 RepID=UPI003BEEBFE1